MVRFILAAMMVGAMGAALDSRAQASAVGPAAPSSAVLHCPKLTDGTPRVRSASSAGTASVRLYVSCDALMPVSVTPAAPTPASAPGGSAPAAPTAPASAASAVKAASAAASSESAPGRTSTERQQQQLAAASAPKLQDNLIRDALTVLMAVAALALIAAGARLVFIALEATLWPQKVALPKDVAPPTADEPPFPGEAFTFRRHWGSLGGESTGWNMSPRLARLLAGVVVAAVGVWMLLHLLASTDPIGKGAASAPDDTKPRTGAETK